MYSNHQLYRRCSERNQTNEIGPLCTENHCHYCFTPRKHGNFVVKTETKHSKIGKLQKQRATKKLSFVVVNVKLHFL